MTTFHRRTLLAGSVQGLAALTLLPHRLQAAASNPAWQDIEDGLALVRGAGGNVLVFSGSEGTALIDGGHAASSEALLALVRDRTGQRPALLFNTHCHRDQVGSNATLGRAGATIIAHENTRLWLTTEIISKWEDTVYPPMPEAALPDRTFWYDSETLSFNGEPLEYGYLPQGHTDGDIYVRFPQRNLIMAGGVVATTGYPLVDYSTNGWIGGMINSLERLLAISDDQTRFFASEGTMVDKAHVQAQLDLCYDVAEKIGAHYYAGGTWPEFVATSPTADHDDRWGDPSLFLHTAYAGTLPHVTEIRRFARRR